MVSLRTAIKTPCLYLISSIVPVDKSIPKFIEHNDRAQMPMFRVAEHRSAGAIG